MTSSSRAASRRSQRLHATQNVRENLRKERERALARQTRLEQLAAPIAAVAAELDKLDAVIASRTRTAERKIEQLIKNRDHKIAAIRADFDTKIEQARTNASATPALSPEEQQREEALLLDHARAIIEFTQSGTPRELGSVLGVTTREARHIIDSARIDLTAVEDTREAHNLAAAESQTSTSATT